MGLEKVIPYTMDSEQAKAFVIKAFFEVEDFGPIYSGDNIEMLLALRPEQRKEFAKCRHQLSKLAMKGQLDRQDLIESFTKVFAGRL